MADKKAKKDKGSKKARKKALGLAAVATAAAVTPAAADVVVQKLGSVPQASRATAPTVPEPKREEYMKPRPVKNINDLLQEHRREINEWSE